MLLLACLENGGNSIAKGTFALDIINSCDKWANVHVVAPFILSMFASSWWFGGFFFAPWGEIAEYVAAWALGSFAIFVTTGNTGAVDANLDIESIAAIFVTDIFIQGVIVSTLLSVAYIYLMKPPVLWKFSDLWQNPITFWYYTFMVLGGLVILPAVTFDVNFGAYQFGITLTIVYYLFFAILIGLTQPESSWNQYEANERQSAKWKFFLSWFVPSVVLQIQNHFDYFFGGAPQSWLWTGVLILVALFIHLKKGTFKRFYCSFWVPK